MKYLPSWYIFEIVLWAHQFIVNVSDIKKISQEFDAMNDHHKK